MPETPERPPEAGRNTSHRGCWFRSPGRGRWHTEAHREYGVVPSACGVWGVLAQAEIRAALAGDDAPCTKCGSRKA